MKWVVRETTESIVEAATAEEAEAKFLDAVTSPFPTVVPERDVYQATEADLIDLEPADEEELK